MKRTFRVTGFLAFSIIQAYGQTPGKPPAFEVASITPCKPGTPEPPMEHTGMAQFTFPGGRFTARATTLKFLLEWAYGMQPSQHSAGPSWIGVDRYDIDAKADGEATHDQMRLMVRTLLAERFHLQVHPERREISAIVISPGKTDPRLSSPKDGQTHGLRMVPQFGPDQKVQTIHIVATRYSLAQLADAFARQIGSVIVNNTGIDGEYDFTLDLVPDDTRPSPVDPALLIGALRDQLGFTVKSQKTLVDFLVIDAARKVAAGN